MRKSIKRFIVTIALLSVVCSLFVSANATEDTPIDYAALFAKAETVDGHSAEAYFYEMNQLFDSDPEAFVLALSKETFKTIETQAFYLAAEHDYSGMDAYETVLNDIRQKHPNDQAVQDTLYLMQMNILYIKNRPNVINPNYFQENYHETVQQYFSDNPQLFLTSLSTKLSTYQANYHIRKLAQAMVYGSNEKELKALDDELQVCENADWADENVQTVVQLLRTKIDTVLNPIDYTALFDKEATMDDGQIEGYYYELNQIFQKDSVGFITALTQRPFAQIYYIGSALAWEQNLTSEDYSRLLDSLTWDYLSDAPQRDTMYVMQLLSKCLQITLSSSNEIDKTLYDRFKQEHRLFFKTMAQMGDQQQAQFMQCILMDRTYDELSTLDAALYFDSTADWATEEVKPVIEMYRNAIKEVIHPAGDPVPDPPAPSDPSPTEPAVTIPTTGQTIPTAPAATFSTPIDTAPSWLIPIIIVSAIMAIGIIVLVILKKCKF
jgi:hypothetical protein